MRQRGRRRPRPGPVAGTSMAEPAAELTPDGRPAAPVTAEHRYRLSAAIRPLLFWVGARATWAAPASSGGRTGTGGRATSCSSGPTRRGRRAGSTAGAGCARTPTPRARRCTASDEPLRGRQPGPGQGRPGPGKDGYLFKLNRARVEHGVARAEATTVYAPQDYTFRQLDELLRFAESAKPTPRVRRAACPRARTPGLLFALADLVRAGVEAARTPGGAGPTPRTVQYTFNAGVYDLTVSSWERVERAQYGARTYEKLVRLEFESRNREKGTTERFVLRLRHRGGPRRGAGVRALPAEVVVQGRGRARRVRDAVKAPGCRPDP